MSEDWKQYEKEMNIFFSDLKRCSQGHEGQCCYLGTLEERLKKHKEIRKRNFENKITEKNKFFNNIEW